MLKDIVVNLSSQGPRDFAAEYATSIAAMFGAHITAVSFVYEPVIPDGMLGGVPVDLIELQRQENSKAANDAISRFDAAAKKVVERLGIDALMAEFCVDELGSDHKKHLLKKSLYTKRFSADAGAWLESYKTCACLAFRALQEL